MKKNKFPKKLLVVIEEDTDDAYLIPHERAEDISESFADKPVAVYELITIGKFTVDKHLDAAKFDSPKKAKSIIDVTNMRHNDMIDLVQKLRLKLYTKGMSTKKLREHLSDYIKENGITIRHLVDLGERG